MPQSYLIRGAYTTPPNVASAVPVVKVANKFTAVALTANELTYLNRNLWTAAQVDRETVLPYRRDIPLLRSITSISRVENLVAGIVYPPADYSVVAGNLRINVGGSIPMLAAAWPNTASGNPTWAAQSIKKDGSPIRLEWDYFPNQLEVTYAPSATLAMLANPSPLPRLASFVKRGLDVGITFVGDSITVGGDASITFGWQPLQQQWAKLVAGYLTTLSPAVVYRNVATGGMTAAFGADQNQTDLQVATDVLVIAYGMNDQAGRMTKATLKSHYNTMIARTKAYNANAEFVFVSGMRPQLEWAYSYAYLMDVYREAMIELVAELAAAGTYAVLVDVTSEWDRAMTRKVFADITTNGVNHPNDFGHVLYAQTILSRLGFLG